jgi:hypothetical protein
VSRIPTAVNLGFLDRSRYFVEIASQLSLRGWVDPVPNPLLLRKSGSAGNGTKALWICSQELWPRYSDAEIVSFEYSKIDVNFIHALSLILSNKWNFQLFISR